MLTGKDGIIQGLMNEIEIEYSTERFGYALDSCSEDIECCEDLEFVVAEWDVCLRELLSPGIYYAG